MTIVPLSEPGHTGYAIAADRGTVVIDAPLDIDACRAQLTTPPRAVVETGIPSHRVAGGRLLAAALDIPLYGPAGVAGAIPLEDLAAGDVEIEVVAGHYTVAVDTATLLIGDLATIPWAPDPGSARAVVEARRMVAASHSQRRLLGSGGEIAHRRLIGLDPPATGAAPLNAEAITLTNSGRADMFWADPRTGQTAPEVSIGDVNDRLGSPWGPVILDLRGTPSTNAVRHLDPSRVASELAGLTAERQIVVVADSEELAELTAGFLAALGLSAAWARPD